MVLLIVLICAFALWVLLHVIFTAMDTHYTPGHYAKCWRCRLFRIDPEGADQPEGSDR